MGLMKMMREEGRQEGIQQVMGMMQSVREEGKQEGIPIGELSLLKRQLVRSFRQIPAWAQNRMEKAAQKDLEIWADRILDASSVEEVFGIQKREK